MSDAVRMIDLAPLTRGLEGFRGADPEHRTMADRVAAQAAVRHLAKVHEDVGAPEGSAKAKIDEPTDRNQRHRSKHQDDESDEPRKREPIPEQEEGRLLDIKA